MSVKTGTVKLYIVDAFTGKLFGGNPAAVCPLESWLPDTLMQQIAFENNLAETAFVVKEETGYRIRWFTPAVEVDLCGHATLASAHVLFNHLGFNEAELRFNSRSGPLAVTRQDDYLTLDFPADELTEVQPSDDLLHCFNETPVAIYEGKTDYMFIFNRQEDIVNIQPHFDAITRLRHARGIIITAPGKESDFVSRFFAPQSGIPEDPVTGSAHTSLTPYWSARLGKTKLRALQLSQRKGELICKMKGERVLISGRAVTYLTGDIQTNNL